MNTNFEKIILVIKQFLIITYLLIPLQTVFSQSITLTQKIFASDREILEHFGYHVQIFDDFAFVCAKTEGTKLGNGGSQEGAVYVFKNNQNGIWVEHQKLVGSDRSGDDHFGSAIGRSHNTLIIGAENFGEKNYGAVYVFQLNNGYWKEQVRLEPLIKDEDAGFGEDIAIAGEYIVVGSPTFGKNKTNNQLHKKQGVIYIFNWDNKGKWNLHQHLSSPNPQLDGRFGLTVNITEQFLVVGAQYESTNSENQDTLDKAGAIYVYEKNITGYWEFKQKLVHSDREKFDYFSWEIKISGNEIFVGVPWKNIKDKKMAGSVYCFEHKNNGKWVEKQKIIPIPSDIQHRSSFGYSLDVFGNILIVGGGNWKNNNGAVYIYVKNECGIWKYRQKITAQGEPLSNNNSDFFGCWSSISSNHMLIGAIYDQNAPGRENLFEAGSAFIFEYEGFDLLDRSCNENKIPQIDGSTFVDSTFYNSSDSISVHFGIDTVFVFNEILDSLDLNTNDSVEIVDVINDEEINENDLNQPSFVVEPNSKERKLVIKIIGKATQPYQVKILKKSGKVVKELTLVQPETEVFLGADAKGLFFIEIYTENAVIKKEAFFE